MVKLPFIQSSAVGIHITESMLYWVEASRIADSVTIHSIDEQPISGSLEQAINQLCARHSHSQPIVSVNIPFSEITYRLVNAPLVDEEDIFDSWLDDQYADMLPDGGTWDEYHICHHLLTHGEESAACLFTMATRESVSNLRSLFESNGIYPQYIGTGILEMAYGLLLTGDFVDGKSTLINDLGQDTCVSQYANGILTELTYLNSDDITSIESIVGDLSGDSLSARRQDSAGQRVYTMSSGNGPGPLLSHYTGLDLAPHIDFMPAADSISFRGESASNSHMVAMGLAMKQLYPDLDEINFVDYAEVISLEQEVEKKDLKYLSAGLASLFIGLLVLALSFMGYSQYRLSETESVANRMAGQIAAVETAADKLQSETLRAQQIQSLIQDRNYFTPLLDVLGISTPQNTWLSRVEIAGAPDKRITILGYSTVENDISLFMDQLEQLSMISSVQLAQSTRGVASDFLDDSPGGEQSLFQFELSLRYDDIRGEQ